MRTRPNLRKLNENQELSEVTTEAREIEGTLTGWVWGGVDVCERNRRSAGLPNAAITYSTFRQQSGQRDSHSFCSIPGPLVLGICFVKGKLVSSSEQFRRLTLIISSS